MSRPMRSSDTDLTKYLPDPETADAATAEPVTYNQDLSRPELVEQLAKFKTHPDVLKAAQPSVAAYVPPTRVNEIEVPTLPTARVKVGAKTAAVVPAATAPVVVAPVVAAPAAAAPVAVAPTATAPARATPAVAEVPTLPSPKRSADKRQ